MLISDILKNERFEKAPNFNDAEVAGYIFAGTLAEANELLARAEEDLIFLVGWVCQITCSDGVGILTLRGSTFVLEPVEEPVGM